MIDFLRYELPEYVDVLDDIPLDRHWILDGHEPVFRIIDTVTWAKWFETSDAERRVADDRIGDVRVSTVFMAIDHDFSGDGPAILFETMIFGGKYDEHQWRYSTWREAEEGHTLAVQAVILSQTLGGQMTMLKEAFWRLLTSWRK